MATMQELETALMNADKAGDVPSAKALAKVISEARKDPANTIPGVQIPGTYETKKEPTLGEKAIGAGETLLTLGTGSTGGAVGMVGGTVKGLYQSATEGKFGTQEGADIVEREAMKGASALTYAPRTETGREYTKETANALSFMPALTPMTPQMQAAASAGRLAGKMPKRSDILQQSVREAEGVGVKPMTTDVFPPKTHVGKLGQAVTERIPFAGTGGKRAAQQTARTGAVETLLRDYGVVDAADAVPDVMTSLLQKRSAQLGKYTDMKTDVINRLSGKGVVGVEKTLSTVDEQINKLQSLKSKSVQPAIALLEDFKESVRNQDLGNIEMLRKQLGEQLADPSLASVKSISEKANRAIYGALREDMGKFIDATGNRRDLARWKVANERLSGMMGELKNTAIRNVLKSGETTPENVRRLLFSKKPSEIKTLYKNLGQEGKRNARIAILQEAVNKVGGIENVTPENFRRQMNMLSKSTGVFFEGADKRALDGLLNALSFTKQAGVAGVKKMTGAEMTAFATPTAAYWLFGGDPVKGAAATVSIGLLSRAFESAPVRNVLIRLSNAPRDKWGELVPQLNAALQPFLQQQEE